jgi:hypothetical protein
MPLLQSNKPFFERTRCCESRASSDGRRALELGPDPNSAACRSAFQRHAHVVDQELIAINLDGQRFFVLERVHDCAKA